MITVAGLRVVRVVTDFLGLDFSTHLAPRMASGSPPFFTTIGLSVQRTEFGEDGFPVYRLQSPLSAFFNPSASQDVVVAIAGGGLALAATQYLVSHGERLPASLILISPWLDVSMTNPVIPTVDDPMLNPEVLKRDGLLWAGNLDPKDPLASPLYGSLEGLPPTYVYAGSLDVLAPDAVVLKKMAEQVGASITFILRRGLIHDWAMLSDHPPGHRRAARHLSASRG